MSRSSAGHGDSVNEIDVLSLTSPSFGSFGPLDEDALNGIADAIVRLKDSNGSLSSTRTWDYNGGGPFNEDVSKFHRISWVGQAKDYLRDLKRTLNSLERLHASATLLQQGIQHGITLLTGLLQVPNEVLLRILVLSFGEQEIKDEVKYRKRVVMLSSVCRHFRNNINDNALFWRNVSNKMHPELLDIALARSKDAALLVTISNPMNVDPVTVLPFFKKLIPLCHRWQTLKLDVYGVGDFDTVATVCSMLPGLDVHMLRHLEYAIPWNVGYDGDPGDQYHFYETWHAPILRRVSFNRLMPRGFASPVPSLTHMWLRMLFGTDEDPNGTLANILDFARSQPSLEHLTIEAKQFQRGYHYHVMVEHPPEYSVVQMPNLRKLIILGSNDLSYPAPMEYIVSTLLRTFATPSLTTMVERLPIAGQDFSLDSVFPPFNDYNSLEDVTLMCSYRGATPPTLTPFQTVFRRAHNLKRLALEAEEPLLAGITPEDERRMGPPPPLVSLCLYGCKTITGDALASIFRYLSHGEHRSKFKQLRLTKCPQLADKVESLADEFGLAPENIIIDTNTKSHQLLSRSTVAFDADLV